MVATEKIIAAAMITASALTGCSDGPVGGGVVTGAEHHQEWVEMMPLKTCFGKPAICTVNLIPVSHPETWTLKLDNGDRTGQRDVTEDAYSRCLIGDTWPDCERSEPHRTKNDTVGAVVSGAMSAHPSVPALLHPLPNKSSNARISGLVGGRMIGITHRDVKAKKKESRCPQHERELLRQRPGNRTSRAR